MGSDFYSLLGLPQDASADEIRTAYFDAARRLHPDANPDPGAKEQFLLIQEAYDTLIMKSNGRSTMLPYPRAKLDLKYP